jgi:Type IV secretory pathway, VirB6 components
MDLTSLFPGLDQLEFLVNLMGALSIVQNAISLYGSEASDFLSVPIRSLLVIYVMLYGWALASGAVRETFRDAAIRVFKIVLVVEFALNFAKFNDVIVDFLWNAPGALILGLMPDAFGVLLEDVFGTGIGVDLVVVIASTVMSAVVSIAQTALQASAMTGTTDPVLYAIGASTGIAGAALGGGVAAILMVARISLAILLALGPLFIVAFMFERTRPVFDGWLSTIITLMLIILLLSLTVFLLFPILLITVSSYYLFAMASGSVEFKDGVELLTLLGIYFAVVKNIPNLAVGIARGAFLIIDRSGWSSGDMAGHGQQTQQNQWQMQQWQNQQAAQNAARQAQQR